MTELLIDSLVYPARVSRHATASRRLRLEVPSLRGDPRFARRLERRLGALPGIVEARADPRTARMLLRYDDGAPLLAGFREEPELPVAQEVALTTEEQGKRAWHSMPIDDALRALETSREGLSRREAQARLPRYGLNAVESAAVRSRLSILGDQVANVPMALLLGSAGLSAILAEAVEATAILAVVGLNAAIGYRIERKNQDILSSWRKLEAGSVDVLRGGSLVSIPAIELVPGDVLVCGAGDLVPADARVIESTRLACDESALTGESEARPKDEAPADPDAPLAGRGSMIFSGTTVVSGRARAVVVATGAATQVARVRSLVEEEEAPRPPLTRRLESLGNRLAAASMGAAAVSAAASIARGRGVVRVARDAVALGVAAIPEGLPLVATAALVRSMQRLQEHGMIVRRLAAAEALGTVTVICADKTGTLTRNEMRLERLELPDGPVDPRTARADPGRVLDDPATLLLAAGVLNSDVELVPRRGRAPGVAGSSTERALVEAGRRAGLDPERLFREFPRLRLWERREDVLYVMSDHQGPRGRIVLVKGAPGQVLGLCDLDPGERARLEGQNAVLAGEGLRVLAFAWRRLDDGGGRQPEDGFEFLGFAGLRDPLREGAAEAIADARDAGIRTVILTGDQPRTAEAIARELGVGGGTLLAKDLEELDPAELQRRLDRTAVLARVTPEDKLEVVRLLQRRGQIVAMAGDGINDAPALKVADVGIAVGPNATDLARQVSDMVMAGEDLRSILVAVGEGRIVQDDIRRSLRFLGATNLSEMALVVGASILGLRSPLSALHLLWINLLTDTLPALALALEPGDPEVLDRKPARPDEPLLGGADLRRVLRDGGILTAVGAAAMMAGGRPLVFAALPAAQLGYAVACRAPRPERSAATGEGMEARAEADLRFAGMVGGAIGLHLFAMTAPVARRLLGLPPPTPLLLGSFAAGALLPWVLRGAPSAEVIVRHGTSGRRSPEAPSSPG